MKIHPLTPFRLASALFRAIRSLPPGRLQGSPHRPVTVPTSEGTTSYVGLFEGVIKSAPHHSPAKASGFLRVEVDRKKKTTGSFMLFSDGRVLAGEMEGAAQSGDRIREASFRLAPARARTVGQPHPAPVTAVGRLRIQSRDHHGVVPIQSAASICEELTIRFVPVASMPDTPPSACWG